MKRVSSALLMFFALSAGAQDFVIGNARIIDGAGGVIERGSVVVRDGKIAAVVNGSPETNELRVVDVRGRTVMPGFIDAHRHIMQGNPDQWLAETSAAAMHEFLAAGFTTVLSAIDPTEQIVELRRRIDAGEIAGPNLIIGGFVPLAGPSGPGAPPGVDPARFDTSRPPNRATTAAPAIPRADTIAAVRRLANAGVDAIKTVITVTPGGPEQATLELIVAEAHRRDLLSITHAVSVQDTLAAVSAGTDILVHTPHIGQLTPQQVETIAGSGIPMTSTLAVFVPYFGLGDTPLFRDLEPFPMNTLSSAGQGPVNARLLWEAGQVLAYGTDTSYSPQESLIHELKPLALVFSPRDIIRIITHDAAIGVGRGDSIGTLEVGKQADIVILAGDPLESTDALLNVEMVIRDGEIVIDNR